MDGGRVVVCVFVFNVWASFVGLERSFSGLFSFEIGA